MKSLSIVKSKQDIDLALAEARAIDPTITLFFMDKLFFSDDSLMQKVKAYAEHFDAIGCSTSGEIAADGVHEDTIMILALHFDEARVRLAKAQVDLEDGGMNAGRSLAEQLNGDKLKSIFLLGPGIGVNGSALVRSLYDQLDPDVVVTGGLAGDGVRFRETFTFVSDFVSHDHAVAFGLYGDYVEVTAGSEGGWRPFGPARLVTKSQGHVLFELDRKPALELYDEYLGTVDRDNPSSRLSYPFAILRDDHSSAGLIRSALGIDRESSSLILAGDLPEGSRVCLMHANSDGLIQGAAQAATEAIRIHKARHELGVAILVSCVGRKLVMNIDADEEIEAVRDSFDEGMTLGGFYAYGEIAPFAKGKRPELHNQTMTITFITEKLPV